MIFIAVSKSTIRLFVFCIGIIVQLAFLTCILYKDINTLITNVLKVIIIDVGHPMISARKAMCSVGRNKIGWCPVFRFSVFG